ncbi:hypothetical protein ENBRE01_3096 [Enteropsectra breve]|nr:hypothetical protein ENBRE01_3096 [Enteropsectra breve]
MNGKYYVWAILAVTAVIFISLSILKIKSSTNKPVKEETKDPVVEEHSIHTSDFASQKHPLKFETHSHAQPQKFETHSHEQPQKFETHSHEQPLKFETHSHAQPLKFETHSHEQPLKFETHSHAQPQKIEILSHAHPQKIETHSQKHPQKIEILSHGAEQVVTQKPKTIVQEKSAAPTKDAGSVHTSDYVSHEQPHRKEEQLLNVKTPKTVVKEKSAAPTKDAGSVHTSDFVSHEQPHRKEEQLLNVKTPKTVVKEKIAEPVKEDGVSQKHTNKEKYVEKPSELGCIEAIEKKAKTVIKDYNQLSPEAKAYLIAKVLVLEFLRPEFNLTRYFIYDYSALTGYTTTRALQFTWKKIVESEGGQIEREEIENDCRKMTRCKTFKEPIYHIISELHAEPLGSGLLERVGIKAEFTYEPTHESDEDNDDSRIKTYAMIDINESVDIKNQKLTFKECREKIIQSVAKV